MSEFTEWLRAELAARHWRVIDLAERTTLSKTTLYRVVTGERRVGPHVATQVAMALDVPVEAVFIRAGLMPATSVSEQELTVRQLTRLIEELSPVEREDLLQYVLFRRRQRQAE